MFAAVVVAFLVTVAFGNSCPPKYVVLFPEVLQVGIEQTIAVSVFSEPSLLIKVQVETFDGFVINGSSFVDVAKGTKELTFTIPCINVTEPSEGGTRYAYVKALTNDPNCPTIERRRVVLSFKSMSVFVHTDRPVYGKDEEVRFLFVAVKPDLTPLDDPAEVTFDIKNPNALTVQRFVLNSASSIQKLSLNLGHIPSLGKWTIRAKYGCMKSVISDFHFQVVDNVLPRFEVIITPPRIISPTDDHIVVGVKSIYTYGKPVVGRLNVTLGVAKRNFPLVVLFRTELFEITFNDKGTKQLTFSNDGYGVFPLGKLLYIHAEVTERANYISQSTEDRSAVFTAVPIVLDCSLSKPFYAPLLSYELKIQVKYANGDIAAYRNATVITHNGKELRDVSDENGIASFHLHIDTPANKVSIRVSVDDKLAEQVCHLQKYKTSCDHYMVLTTRTSVPFTKDNPAKFEIVRGANSANEEVDLNVVVKSCGTIQDTFTKRYSNGTLTFEVKIEPSYCGTVCVAAYYGIECNGESAIISDYYCADVEKKCSNSPSLRAYARDSTVRPGDHSEFTIFAGRYSEISIMAVDKTLYLFSNETGLTKKKIFQELRLYESLCDNNANGVEGVFSTIGLTSLSNRVMSPATHDNKDDVSRGKRDVSLEGGKEVSVTSEQMVVQEKRSTDTRKRLPESNGVAAKGSPVSFRKDACKYPKCFSRQKDLNMRKIRSGREFNPFSILDDENTEFFYKMTYFPRVWLYGTDLAIGAESSLSLTVHFPDTITDWIVRGFALSEQGFCSSDPIFLRAFKPVFVQCQLPSSPRRLEKTTLACTVYNYRYHSSESVCLRLLVMEKDVCTTAGTGSSTDAICFFIEDQSTKTVLFPIVPLQLGISKLKVRLTTFIGGEDVETEIVVEPEGAAKLYSFSTELDPQESNSVSKQDWCTPLVTPEDFRKGYCYGGSLHFRNSNSKNCSGEIIAEKLSKEDCCNKLIDKFAVAWSDEIQCEPCPERLYERQCNGVGEKKQINTFFIRLPENYVAGSDRAILLISGNYFFAALGEIKSFLQEPAGCGEQSVARFASQVAAYEHIRAADEIITEGRFMSIDEIQRVYYNVLNCRTPWGAFTENQETPASTILSAFALQTFCYARNYIAVDDTVVNSLLTFFAVRQAQGGEFLEAIPFSKHQATDQKAYVSALVISGALECCELPNHSLFAQSSITVICKAVKFLELSVEKNLVIRSNTRAIVYAALVKACKTCHLCQCRTEILVKARHILDVVSKIRDDGARFWPSDGAPSLSGVDVTSLETTAHALCAYLDEGRIERARPLAKWLNSERSFPESSQPNRVTVAALRCLSKFASKVPFKGSLTISVSSSRNKTRERVFSVNESNNDLVQTMELPRNDIVRVETTGTGLGMLQVQVKYNEETTASDECKFNFSVSPERLSNNDVLLRVCTQHIGDVYVDKTVVEVELPTGYIACKEGQEHCLKELRQSRGKSIFLRSVEISGRGVIFYFDQIGSSPDNRMCFTFRANREFKARNFTPVRANVYYYNQIDQSCNIFYNLGNEVSNLAVLCSKPGAGRAPLCVCGGGRCPKLEPIRNKMCNACFHHDYVYRVEVRKIERKGEWQKVIVTLVDVLKHGGAILSPGDRIVFWIRLICSRLLPFQIGKNYHVQGKDGIKFVLDYASHVEKWPESLQQCVHSRTQCEQVTCRQKRRNIRKKCFNRCEDREKDCKRHLSTFDRYFRKLKFEKEVECSFPREKLCPNE